MNDDLKFFFYPRKNYVNKNGEVSIWVFLAFHGERVTFTSKIKVPLELWDGKFDWRFHLKHS